MVAGRLLIVLLLCSLLLSNNLASIKFDEHCAVCFEFFDWDRQSEVIQKEELKLQMIEFV